MCGSLCFATASRLSRRSPVQLRIALQTDYTMPRTGGNDVFVYTVTSSACIAL